MEEARFDWQWPKDGLTMDCFAHEIMNYRFHWHDDLYELNILLSGSQEFCIDKSTITLKEDDVILIPPGVGHASFAQEANTRALVLHFSASVFRPFVKKGTRYLFPSCFCDDSSRNEARFRRIRYYAGQIYESACRKSPYSQLRAKASLELLLACLCEQFDPVSVSIPAENDPHQEAVSGLIGYMEAHFSEKITLEDMASFSQYNRTYISTLFKNTTGVNFYEYLTRLRFQHALFELASTEKTLTDIALDNGFSDLKSFNAKFREMLRRTPSEYRAQLSPNLVLPEMRGRRYISPEDPMIQKKLAEYDRI